ncbi:MAG: hypothetical protein R2766_06485 [Saprospiraceae bacterium]
MDTSFGPSCAACHIDENKILLAIDYRKDVDGFHPVNFGRMAQGLIHTSLRQWEY